MTQRVSTVLRSEGVRSRRVKGLHRRDCTWFRQGIFYGDPSRFSMAIQVGQWVIRCPVPVEGCQKGKGKGDGKESDADVLYMCGARCCIQPAFSSVHPFIRSSVHPFICTAALRPRPRETGRRPFLEYIHFAPAAAQRATRVASRYGMADVAHRVTIFHLFHNVDRAPRRFT